MRTLYPQRIDDLRVYLIGLTTRIMTLSLFYCT